MADEAKSTYYGNGNRGQATILQNAWQTPLTLLAKQQEQQIQQDFAAKKQQEQIEAQRRAAQQKILDEAMMANPEGAMVNHLPGITEDKNKLFDYVAGLGGKPQTEAQWLEAKRMANQWNSKVVASKGLNSQIQDLRKTAATHSDKIDMQAFEDNLYNIVQTKSPEEVKAELLKLDRYFDQEKVASGILKDANLKADKTPNLYRDPKTGKLVDGFVETYSPEKLAEAKDILIGSRTYVDATRNKYERQFKDVPENERPAFEQFLETEADTRAKAIQFKNQDMKVVSEKETLAEYEAKLKLKAKYDTKGKAKQKEIDAGERLAYIDAARSGDVGKLKALIGSDTDKGKVTNIEVEDVDASAKTAGNAMAVGNGVFEPGVDFSKRTPVYKLTLITGYTKPTDGSEPKPIYQTRRIDTNADGWKTEISNIMNTAKGSAQVSAEDLTNQEEAAGSSKKTTGMSFSSPSTSSSNTGKKPTGITF